MPSSAPRRIRSRALLALGVERGDRVALLLPNRPEWLVGVFPAAKAGAITVAVSTFSTPRELARILEHVRPRVLGSVITNGFAIGERQHLTAADRLWLAVPLFWSFCSANALPAILTHGGTRRRPRGVNHFLGPRAGAPPAGGAGRAGAVVRGSSELRAAQCGGRDG